MLILGAGNPGGLVQPKGHKQNQKTITNVFVIGAMLLAACLFLCMYLEPAAFVVVTAVVILAFLFICSRRCCTPNLNPTTPGKGLGWGGKIYVSASTWPHLRVA